MEEQELIVLRGTVPISTLIMLELVRRQNRKQSKHGTIGQVNRMDDLISRKEAIETAKKMYVACDTNIIDDYEKLMEEALKVLPSAEPQIIRCKDCKYYGVERTIAFGFYFHVCELLKSTPIRHDDDFCSRAERREDG